VTGKYLPGKQPAKDTRAASEEMGGFMGEQLMGDRVLSAVQQLKPIAAELKCSLAQLALAWVLREPNVASAIVGASRAEQVEENASAAGIELSGDTLRAIDEALGDVVQYA